MMAGNRGAREQELYDRFFAFWRNPPGWRAASAVNHTSIGHRFILTGLMFFLIGGLLAMAIRAQLAWPGNASVDHQTYHQLVTMHGTTMMFLFAVPVMEGFAIYLIPKMIGARDLPLPRLSALGYWSLLFGGIFLYSSFLVDAAPDGGWFMYVPLNSRPYAPGLNADFWLLGVTFVEISAVAAAIELIVAILKTRAPGMSLARMPLFAWYILVVAFMILFAFPPLILASALLELERNFGFVFYDAARGGDPLLWQHLFWIFGHPEVYIIFLPAAGIVTMVVETFSRRPLVGYTWVVMAVVATGFISFGLWVHHMYTTGIPRLSLNFFAAASLAVAIPSGIQVFAWIATLWNGRPVVSVPLLYVLGFLFTFVLGGLTGVMVALVPFDAQVHDTHFVVAHLHYVLFGGMVFPLFAGLYYWLPLVSGRVPSRPLAHVGFWTVFAGFNVTFLPMHLTGMLGMPRRVYTYSQELGVEWLNLVSTVGGFVLTAGVALIVLDVFFHFRFGSAAGRNAWNAGTLEWGLPTPVPPFNFVSIPPVRSRLPMWDRTDLMAASERGEHFLGDPGPQRRETLGTSVSAAEPQQVIVLPTSTWLPLWVGIAAIAALVGILLQAYWLSALGTLATIAVLLVWAWQSPCRHAPLQIEAGQGYRLPTQVSSGDGPGLWSTGAALAASGAVFGSLVFAYFYLWTAAPPWPPADYRGTTWTIPVLGILLLLASSGTMHWAQAQNRQSSYARLRLGLSASIALGVAYLLLLGAWLGDAFPRPGEHAYASVVYAIHGFHGLHLAIALLAAGFGIARSRRGYIDADRPLELNVAVVLWHYAVVLGIAAAAVVSLSPRLL